MLDIKKAMKKHGIVLQINPFPVLLSGIFAVDRWSISIIP